MTIFQGLVKRTFINYILLFILSLILVLAASGGIGKPKDCSAEAGQLLLSSGLENFTCSPVSTLKYPTGAHYTLNLNTNTFIPVSTTASAGEVCLLDETIKAQPPDYLSDENWNIFPIEMKFNEFALTSGGDYLWTGTTGGLVRRCLENPNELSHFTNMDPLPHPLVRDVAARGEEVWFATDAGAGKRVFTDDLWWYIQIYNEVYDSASKTYQKKHLAFRSIDVDSKGQVLTVLDDNLGVILYDVYGEYTLYTRMNTNLSYDQFIDSNGNKLDFKEVKPVLPPARMETAVFDKNSGFWVGGFGLTYVGFDGTVNRYTAEAGDLSHNNVRCLVADNQGGLWIGTFSNGATYRTADGSFVHYTTDNSSIPSFHVRDILVDNKGRTWLASSKQLAILDDDKNWIVFSADNSPVKDEAGLLTMDKYNRVWYATPDNYYVFIADGELLDPVEPKPDPDPDPDPSLPEVLLALYWQNTETGLRYVYFYDGTGSDPVAMGGIGTVPSTWNIVDAGDLDGDGKTDIVWHNTETGLLYAWLMDGLEVIGMTGLGQVANTAWKAVALGDMNGNGSLDIIWENSANGNRLVWYMEGTAITGFGSLPSRDPAWSIVAAADMNSSGHTDLLWQKEPGAEREIWLMEGLEKKGSVTLGPDLEQQWRMVAAGDFNASGDNDIIWENRDTGLRYIWFMDGTGSGQPVAQGGLGIFDLSWQIVGLRINTVD